MYFVQVKDEIPWRNSKIRLHIKTKPSVPYVGWVWDGENSSHPSLL